MAIWAEGLPESPDDDWTPALRREVGLLRAAHGIDRDSVTVKTDPADQSVLIGFVVITDDLTGDAAAAIADREPMVFNYAALDSIGLQAPIVVSDRMDFPRDIGHINPTKADTPACLCLARPDHQALYERFGITGMADRLVQWLRDAKTGGLMAEGWHPVPVMHGQRTYAGVFDASAFQDIAATSDNAGSATGVAGIYTQDADRRDTFVLSRPYSSEPVGTAPLVKALEHNQGFGSGIIQVPWIFAWSRPDVPIDAPVFGLWETLTDAYAALAPCGVQEVIEAEFGKVLLSGAKYSCAGKYAMVLLVGIWRPKPLLPSIFGLSTNEQSRHLEVKSYLIEWSLAHRYEVPTGQVTITEIASQPLPSPALHQHMSNLPEMQEAAQLGCGALGSEIADNLLRAGVGHIAIADKDTYHSHNLSRSTANMDDLGSPKVDMINDRAKKLSLLPSGSRVSPLKADIVNMTDDELSTFMGHSRALIDATADEGVRARLVRFPLPEGRKVVRVEVARAGRLGLVTVAASCGPDLLDLYYALVNKGRDPGPVRDWLREDGRGQGALEEVILGFGCSSMTTRLPKFALDQHSSAAMPTIVSALTDNQETGFGINPLDEQYQPLGWQWFPIRPFIQLDGDITDGWNIRLEPNLPDAIKELWGPAGKFEVGGYLYGSVDYGLRRITIISATQVGSLSSEHWVSLLPANSSPDEAPLLRRTGGHVGIVGTWHSHPDGPLEFSERDQATFDFHHEHDKEHGIATLVVVAAPEGLAGLMDV